MGKASPVATGTWFSTPRRLASYYALGAQETSRSLQAKGRKSEPFDRKHFCASTSTATCDQPSGASRSFISKTTLPSGLAIRVVRGMNWKALPSPPRAQQTTGPFRAVGL